jgi:hypothetical protein
MPSKNSILSRLGLLLSIIMMFACQTKNSIEISGTLRQEKLHELVEQYPKAEHILIIPGSGCEGCISNAENFVITRNTEKDDGKFLYIFTNISSPKILKLRLGSAYSEDDIHLDLKNELQYKSIYPVYLEKSKGKFLAKELSDKILTLD